MKNLKIAIIAAVTLVLTTGCITTEYQNGHVNMNRNADGSFNCGGAGASSRACGDVFDVLITEEIKENRSTPQQRGTDAGLDRFCRDYPNAKRCQGN